MKRIIHNQTTPGALLINDIDDGLPNKTVHRLTGDPAGYTRDGYANSPKQSCYVPYLNAANTALPGYIDLEETSRVTLSSGKGTIHKMESFGLVAVVDYIAGDLSVPIVTSATYDVPTPGSVRIIGTTLTSIAPEQTSVSLVTHANFTVLGASVNGNVRYVAVDDTVLGQSITVRHVVAGNDTPLSVSVVGTAITVNVATDGGGAATSTSTLVEQAIANSVTASALVTAYAGGDGSGIVSSVGVTSLTGFEDLMLTQSEILTASGTITAMQIDIPSTLVPNVRPNATYITVTANLQTSVVPVVLA